jgi:hypothetical protein
MSRLLLLVLLPISLLIPILHATTEEEEEINEARCTDLNFRAANLQGGDACRVLTATILATNFLAATMFDVTRACHPANSNCIANALIVADEIKNIPNCEISSGTNVATFLKEVQAHQLGFTSLMQLACYQYGECYQSILDGVDYCTAHPDMDWAGNCLLNNVTCDNDNGGCLLDYLLPVVTSLPDHAPKGDTTNFTYIVRDAEARCYCESLSTRAKLLETNDTSCRVAVAIVNEEDILIGNSNITMVVEKLDDTCDIPTEYTCLENALDIARGIGEYVCEDIGDTTFVNMLRNSSTDFDDITNFACRSKDCYITLMACADTLGSSSFYSTTTIEEEASGTTDTVSMSPSESPSSSHQPSSSPSYTPSEQNTNFTCNEPLSCNCLTEFSSVTSNLSPTMKESLLKFNTTLLEKMRATTCCSDFNVEAANLIKMDYCSLHRAIVLEGSIFAGTNDEINVTCNEQAACVGNITEVLSKMKQDNCRVKQESDDIAESLYYVNITTDFDAITKFICGNRECYNAVKGVVESCTQNSNTTATLDCLRSFMTVVNDISDEGSEVYLGISEYEMERVIPNWYLAMNERIANMATTQTTTSVIACISFVFVTSVFS